MSTTNNSFCREAIRRTMAHHAGVSPDADAIAEATFIIWNLVEGKLAPVIGMKGVDVLFRRSMHLTTFSFPWLASAEVHTDNASLFASIKARLASGETDASTEAGCTFLLILTELLTTLIGESLTWRLLGTVWKFPSPNSEQENVS
jgi:hypothetical protein